MASHDGECGGAVGGIGINKESDFPQDLNESSLVNDLIDVHNLKLDDDDDW